jgi:hypothetical protein
MYSYGIGTEMQGGGRFVVEGARHATPYLLRSRRWGETATLLERMIAREATPTTLALAISHLRLIAEQIHDTEEALMLAGVIGKALRKAGRYAEAEAALREVLSRCIVQDDYKLASAASAELFTLLLYTSRFEEALQTAEDRVSYACRAGLGPWTQLVGEGQRLQALNALGRYDEVLAAVEQHRVQMKDLPEESAAAEIANPWSVREVLLNTGFFAALHSAQWETALAFNAEGVDCKRSRDAGEAEIARGLLNDCTPLLRLRRSREARLLLEHCRAVFEREGAVYELSAVFSALAELEDAEGHPMNAARFEQTALRYVYQTGRPEDCAGYHHNIVRYIGLSGSHPEAALAHGFAAGVIRLQIGSGRLSHFIRNFARLNLPPAPPSFAQVCATVEQIEGVRFRELFEQLPRKAPDGDAAIRAVWEMAKAEAERLKEGAERRMRELLSDFEPLLQAVAAVARGEMEERQEIEELLPQLEENGWHIADAVRRVWAGERDAEALTAGIDPSSAALVRRVLELLEGSAE